MKPSLFLVAIGVAIVILGGLVACTPEESPPPPPTPAPQQPLPNSSELPAVGPASDNSRKVDRIIGVKMEHNSDSWHWLPLLVLVQENTTTSRTFLLMVDGRENLAIITDVSANDPCWLKFIPVEKYICNPGLCTAQVVELHLHSLDELH